MITYVITPKGKERLFEMRKDIPIEQLKILDDTLEEMFGQKPVLRRSRWDDIVGE